MATKTFAAFAALILLAGCKPSGPSESVKDLMKNKVDPASKIYFEAVSSSSELVDGKVVETNIAPQSDADWDKVRKAAADLQDYGKQLKGDDYTKGRNPDWAKFSQALVDVSKQAEQAAKDKDKDKVFEISGTMYNVCSACHMAYPPPVPEVSGAPAPSPSA